MQWFELGFESAKSQNIIGGVILLKVNFLKLGIKKELLERKKKFVVKNLD